VLTQYPGTDGALRDIAPEIAAAHAAGAMAIVAADLLALTLVTPPARWGRTSWSAPRSASGCRSAMAGRMPASSP
jgi:hypothetical protein